LAQEDLAQDLVEALPLLAVPSASFAMMAAVEEHPIVGAASILSSTYGWPTTYEVWVDRPSGAQIVHRRYTDFLRLRQGLLQEPDTRMPLPELPAKALPMYFSTLRDQRRDGLNNFLTEAMSRSNPESEPWHSFIGMMADAGETFVSQALDVQGAIDHANTEAELLEVAQLPEVIRESTRLAEDQLSVLSAQPPVLDEVPAPRSEMDEIREMRRQRWKQASANDAAVSELVSAPAQSTSSAARCRPVAEIKSAHHPDELRVPFLTRLNLLPLQELPAEHDGQRLQLLKSALKRAEDLGVVVEAGQVLEGLMGLRFCVIKCSPDRGRIDASTETLTSGPVLPRLERIQLIGLRQHRSRENPQMRAADGRQQLFDEHVVPHFKNAFADPSRCSVVRLGDTPQFNGLRFEISAFDHGVQFESQQWGIVDQRTNIFTSLHPLPEFSRIHVVPFSDTLPSAYDFDIFRDYAEPFFASHTTDGFREGQTFFHNAVQFKIMVAEPPGLTCRAGAQTQIFTAGQVHPTAAEFLTPDEARQLAVFPPGLQLLLIERNMMGDSDIAERIMAAQSGHTQERSLTAQTIGSLSEEVTWSEDVNFIQDTDQTECTVCLSQFENGDRVRILPCQHVFHAACVDEWLGRDPHCPLCRQSIRA